MFEPVRGGTRGGQAEFKWSDVSADKDRENYLGHSINAPTGRWQKNKDIHWYNRENEEKDEIAKAEARAEEIRKIKEMEADALAVALGFEPSSKTSGSNSIPVASTSNTISGQGTSEDAEKLERKRRKEERKAEKKAKKELKKMSRTGAHGVHELIEQPRRHPSRSRSPRFRSKERKAPNERRPRSRSRSRTPPYERRTSRTSDIARHKKEDYGAEEREKERERDRRRWNASNRDLPQSSRRY